MSREGTPAASPVPPAASPLPPEHHVDDHGLAQRPGFSVETWDFPHNDSRVSMIFMRKVMKTMKN